jgi:peptidoglycan/xylan/chitin deacetylase (PgdA/CDA1 family)
MYMVLWSALGYDWKKDASGIVRSTLRGLGPGAVILLHDGREARPPAEVDRSETVQALPAIIEGARQRGYAFAPLQEFLPTF